MSYRITLIPGDGIGPELTEATLKVLDAVQKKINIKLEIIKVEAGDGCFERSGRALPDDTLSEIKRSVACIKGPIGETARDVVIKLRQMFDLYANVRPLQSYPNVPSLRPDIDLVFARENTEGLYKGIEFKLDDTTVSLRVITRRGCERIAKYAFELAKQRNKKKKVTAVHKANVMKVTCGLFADVCRETAKAYPEIVFNELYVDAAAMQLIRAPHEFDVIVTTNIFGDILSDEAAQVVGGLGLAPGGNIGDDFAMFEPVHGAAFDIAGKNIANPCSMILSAKMMLEWLGARYNDSSCKAAAQAVERSVVETLSEGVLTPDLGGHVKTDEIGEIIAKKI